MTELLTLDQYDHAIASGHVIVVIDKPEKRAKVHAALCSHVKRQHFELKVVKNYGEYGSYKAFTTLSEAREKGFSDVCKECHGRGPTTGPGAVSVKRGMDHVASPVVREPRESVTQFSFRESSGIVEAWSAVRLGFEPKGWLQDFKGDLRNRLLGLNQQASGHLAATFTEYSATLRNVDKVDAENVLFFNLGFGENASSQGLDRIAGQSLLIERSFGLPPTAPGGLALPSHHHYEVIQEPCDAQHWEPRTTLASWKGIPCTSPRAWKSSAYLWHLMHKAANVKIHAAGRNTPEHFGLSIVIDGPDDTLPLLDIVKATVDGIVLAFQRDDGRTVPSGIEQFASKAGLTPDEVAVLLRSEERAVLGTDVLLRKNGVTNPCDDRCVVVSLRRGRKQTEWRLSGKVFTVSPRE